MSEDRNEMIERVASEVIAEMEPIMNPETDLRVLMKLAHENASAKGFHDYGRELSARIMGHQAIIEERPEAVTDSVRKELAFLEDTYRRYLGNALMLIVGEASEGHEEIRSGREPDDTYFEVTASGSLKPLGFPSELADIFIRVLDTAAELGIDLPSIVAIKMAYNSGRATMHGGKTM